MGSAENMISTPMSGKTTQLLSAGHADCLKRRVSIVLLSMSFASTTEYRIPAHARHTKPGSSHLVLVCEPSVDVGRGVVAQTLRMGTTPGAEGSLKRSPLEVVVYRIPNHTVLKEHCVFLLYPGPPLLLSKFFVWITCDVLISCWLILSVL